MTDYRVGIMGGTFDPIHLGHLAIAEAVREKFSLNKVLFIPAASPPHKQGKKIAAAVHRLEMTRLAVADNPYFVVSDMELKREGPSYTADTLKELRRGKYADASYYFITGTDAANEMDTWYKPREILSECQVIVTTRRGANLDPTALAENLGQIVYAKIHEITTPLLEISSTDIRRRIGAGESIRYLVPEAVRKYIEQERLYR